MPQTGGTSGWTDSRLDLVKIQLLDLVQENTGDGQAPEIAEFASHLTEDPQLLHTAAEGLSTDGLVQIAPIAAPSLFLNTTPAGDALVQRRRERRSNRKLRPVACREALLDWCYVEGNTANIGNFPADVRAHFEGDPFTSDEVEGASIDLKEKGLITGGGSMQGGIIRPTVTAAGKSVVEDYNSSISAYETRAQSPKGQTTIHIEGSTFSGQLAVGDYNQVTQNNGVGTSEFTELVMAVLEAAKGTSEEQRVGKLVTQLQMEADEEDPEPTFVGKTLDRLEDTAVKTGSDALVLAATKLIQYIHDHGIPQALGLG